MIGNGNNLLLKGKCGADNVKRLSDKVKKVKVVIRKVFVKWYLA